MNFKEWLINEALEYQPENWTQFIRKTKNKLSLIERELSSTQLNNFLNYLNNVDKDNFSSRMIQLFDAAFYLIEKYAKILENVEQWHNKPIEIVDDLAKETCSKIDFNRTFKAAKDLTKTTSLKDYYNEYLDMFIEQEEILKNTSDEESYQIIKNVINKVERIFKLADKYIEIIENFENKLKFRCKILLGAQGRMSDLFYTRDVFPPHEDFEIMYHATTNAPAIMREGFKTREQLRKQGLGGGLGGGPENVVSFTANPKIAEKIAQSMKYTIKIAKGEITDQDVIKKYNRFGIFKPKDLEEKPYKEGTKKKALWLFRLAQGRMDEKGLAYDPWIAFPDMELLAKLDPNNIGIIQAKIDMSKIVQYLPAEEEYRVKLDGISEIKRFI